MTVRQMWVGAPTSDGVTVVARVTDAEEVRLLAASDAEFSSPIESEAQQPDDDGVVKLVAQDLEPQSAYHLALELDGQRDADITGTVETLPVVGQAGDFTVAFSSCAGLSPEYPGEGEVAAAQRLTNHPVFDVIREARPVMFVHLGDMHYYDIGSGEYVDAHDVATYRAAFDDVFAQSRQHELYRSVASQYLWDDHDYGPNNSDSSAPGREAACQVYRERVPHYDLVHDEGIWQAWIIGRVAFVGLDVRSFRDDVTAKDDGDKSMLGAAQKEWLHETLSNLDAKMLVLLTPTRWFDDSVSDSWSSYTHERSELIDLFDSAGWTNRMCIVSGDVHAAAIETGGNSPGRMPLFHFGSIDSTPSEEQEHYDSGPTHPGRGQYGLLRFTDDGGTITVAGTAYNGEDELVSHKFEVTD